MIFGGPAAVGRPEGFALSDVGRVRTDNEDALYASDEDGLYVVADGIGGYARGEVASGLVVDAIREAWRPTGSESAPAALTSSIREANAQVFAATRDLPREAAAAEPDRMGSTVVALTVTGSTATIAHVGDSRAYRLRDGHLAALTVDHTVGAQRAAQGGSVGARFRSLLTRAVGIGPEVAVEVRQETVRPGDLFLLCSDGLTNMVSEARMAAVLSENPSLEGACRALLAEANANGGKDNASVILVRC